VQYGAVGAVGRRARFAVPGTTTALGSIKDRYIYRKMSAVEIRFVPIYIKIG